MGIFVGVLVLLHRHWLGWLFQPTYTDRHYVIRLRITKSRTIHAQVLCRSRGQAHGLFNTVSELPGLNVYRV